MVLRDPLRAKFIAEQMLENATCYTEIRNMFGFIVRGHPLRQFMANYCSTKIREQPYMDMVKVTLGTVKEARH